jgi:hypothetical protein
MFEVFKVCYQTNLPEKQDKLSGVFSSVEMMAGYLFSRN